MPTLQELRALKASKPKSKVHEASISRINKFLKECPLDIFDGSCVHGSDYDPDDPDGSGFSIGKEPDQCPAYCTERRIDLGESHILYHIIGTLNRKHGEVEYILYRHCTRMVENEEGEEVRCYRTFEYNFETGQFEGGTSRMSSPNKYLKMILSDLENQ